MARTILVTGASSGFGEMTSYALADAGHTVFASMHALIDDKVRRAREHSATHNVDLRTIALDVQDETSVAAAVAHIIGERGAIDVLVHNAGHMSWGPAEAFLPEQLARLYDINVLGAHRLNRAALPHMRRAGGDRLIVWVGSTSSVRSATPPYVGPYFAAKAAMESLAVSYAAELARWGIETVIASPGVFTHGTNHFADADRPGDAARVAAKDQGPPRALDDQARRADLDAVPADADPAAVARRIAEVIAMPYGTRPFRVTIDPADSGADELNRLSDRLRAGYLTRAGMGDLLRPATD